MAEAKPCKNHPTTLTRLCCPECDEPVCPKCTVQYEVAFKCTACAREYTSHAMQVSGKQLIWVGFLALLAGLIYGNLQGLLFNVFLAIFASYGLGWLAGKALHRAVRYNMNPKIALVATVGLLVGLLASPWQLSMLGLIFSLAAGAPMSFGLLLQVLWVLGGPAIFVISVQRVLKSP